LKSVHLFYLKAGEQIQLFVTKPPELQQQRNITMKVTSDGSTELKEHCKAEGFSSLMESTVHAKKAFNFQIEIEWEFRQRFLDERADNEVPVEAFPLSEEDRKLFLRGDNFKYNFADKVQIINSLTI
jgi:hypothetical protein